MGNTQLNKTSRSRKVSEVKRFAIIANVIFLLLIGLFLLGIWWLLYDGKPQKYWYSYTKAKEILELKSKGLKSDNQACKSPVETEAIRPDLLNNEDYILDQDKCIFIGNLEPLAKEVDDITVMVNFVGEKNSKILISAKKNKIKLWDITKTGEDSEKVFSTNPSEKFIQKIDQYTQPYFAFTYEKDKGLEPEQVFDPSLTPPTSPTPIKGTEFTSIVTSPDGKKLAIGMSDGTVEIWQINLNQGDATQIFDRYEKQEDKGKGSITALAFSYDGKFLVSGTDKGTIQLWNLEQKPAQGNSPIEVETKGGLNRVISALAFNPKRNDILAVGTSVKCEPLKTGQGGEKICKPINNDQQNIQLWQIESSNTLTSIDIDDDKEDEPKNPTDLDINSPDVEFFIRSLNFSPNGKFLVSGSGKTTVEKDGDKNSTSYRGSVSLWKVDLSSKKVEGIPVTFLEGHEDWVNAVKFSPDGQILATGSVDGKVKLWDMREVYGKNPKNNTSTPGQSINLSALKTLPHSGSVLSVAFSPNGKTLTSMDSNGQIKLRQLQ